MHNSNVLKTYEMRGKSAVLMLKLFLQQIVWRPGEA